MKKRATNMLYEYINICPIIVSSVQIPENNFCNSVENELFFAILFMTLLINMFNPMTKC